METIHISSLGIQNGQRVLDIGCGEGRHSIAAHYHFPNAKVFAIDINFHDLSTGNRRHRDFAGQLHNCLYCQGDAYQLPFADLSFDHIICSEVLEHVEDYERLILEIKRVLKIHGSLSVSVPRAWPEKICWHLSEAYHTVEGGHVRIFKQQSLQRDIEAQGFDFKTRHWAHALHSPYWWLRCLFWREHDPQHGIVRAYHALLVWDLLSKPLITRVAEKILNPIMGKSLVMYFTKTGQ